jgi:hypothetical protein
MLALRVSVNGAKPVTAGFSGPHVLSAIVASVLRDPGKTAPTGEPLPERELGLTLGGLDTTVREHVDWANVQLAVGDKVVVEVIELGSVDPPLRARGGKGEDSTAAKPAKAGKAAKASRPKATKPQKSAAARRVPPRSAPAKRASSKTAAGKRKRRA